MRTALLPCMLVEEQHPQQRLVYVAQLLVRYP